MPKKITMTAKQSSATADDWVAGSATTEITAPETEASEAIAVKRLTIDIPEELHARIKSQCALRRSKMADEIRKLLENSFPESA